MGAVSVIVLGALLLMGQAKQGTVPWQRQVLRVGTVQANTIEVLPEGAVYSKGSSAVPTVRINGGQLTMFDAIGKPRVSLDGNASALQMGELEPDDTGHFPLFKGSTVTLDGYETGGSLWLNDRDRKQTISLSTSASRASLHLVSDAPTLSVGGEKHDATVIDTQEIVSSGRTYTTSAAAIFLFDEKGNSIWSAEQAAILETAANYLNIQTQNLQLDADTQKQELHDFKEAVCPALRTARIDDITRTRLNTVCD